MLLLQGLSFLVFCSGFGNCKYMIRKKASKGDGDDNSSSPLDWSFYYATTRHKPEPIPSVPDLKVSDLTIVHLPGLHKRRLAFTQEDQTIYYIYTGKGDIELDEDLCVFNVTRANLLLENKSKPFGHDAEIFDVIYWCNMEDYDGPAVSHETKCCNGLCCWPQKQTRADVGSSFFIILFAVLMIAACCLDRKMMSKGSG